MIVKSLKKLRKQNIIFVVGTFDILHIGHLSFLKKAKEVAPKNKLLVGIIPDKIVKKRKHHTRPVIPQKQRLELVDALKPVDFSFILPATDVAISVQKVITEAQPEIAVISDSDWKRIKGNNALSNIKISLIKSKVKGISTTHIISRIKKR